MHLELLWRTYRKYKCGKESRLSKQQQYQPEYQVLESWGDSSSEVNFKRLWITITIVYIHPFNAYRDLNSYMKRLAINANGNTITSFAREINPTWVGEYISFKCSDIYIYIYIYIYIRAFKLYRSIKIPTICNFYSCYSNTDTEIGSYNIFSFKHQMREKFKFSNIDWETVTQNKPIWDYVWGD